MRDKINKLLYRIEDSFDGETYRKEWEKQNIEIDKLEQRLSKYEKRYTILLKNNKKLERKLKKYEKSENKMGR